MRKVFVKHYLEQIREWFQGYDVYIVSDNIIKKTALKKVKEQIDNINSIKALTEFIGDNTDSVKMMEKFFPTKFGELKSSGLPFRIRKVFYNPDDEKIYCIVDQNGNNRTFKLKTDNYLDRTTEERKKFMKKAKSVLDGAYGYFYLEDENYITDCNKVNGKYKKVNKFDFNSKDDLILC